MLVTNNNARSDFRHVSQTGRERWYVVHTLPRREIGAEFHLGRQGFRTFFPYIVKTVRHARRLRTVRAAAFPRYLFVVLDPDRDPWRSVNGTIGVCNLLMADGRPDPVPHGVVESLIAATDNAGVLRSGPPLKPGQSIRVRIGPFADAIGSLQRLDDRGRVRVLLQIMGGQVPTMLDCSHIEAA
jgi:transcription antitermination factor NusG